MSSQPAKFRYLIPVDEYMQLQEKAESKDTNNKECEALKTALAARNEEINRLTQIISDLQSQISSLSRNEVGPVSTPKPESSLGSSQKQKKERDSVKRVKKKNLRNTRRQKLKKEQGLRKTNPKRARKCPFGSSGMISYEL